TSTVPRFGVPVFTSAAFAAVTVAAAAVALEPVDELELPHAAMASAAIGTTAKAALCLMDPLIAYSCCPGIPPTRDYGWRARGVDAAVPQRVKVSTGPSGPLRVLQVAV